MKKIHALLIGWLFIFLSCSKKDTLQPAPSGSVVAAPTSINYGAKAVFSYNFVNAEIGVWIGGKKMTGQSGNYTTDPLFRDSSFSVIAEGTGGQKIFGPINITVGQDPRLALLLSGVFVRDGYKAKPVDSSDAYWTNVSLGCDTYSFQYINQIGISEAHPPYHPPGNPQITTNGSCTATPGTTTAFGWGFYPLGQVTTLHGITSTGVFFWHGLFYDQFIITYDPITNLPIGFKIHEYGLIVWGGIPVPADIWESYKRL